MSNTVATEASASLQGSSSAWARIEIAQAYSYRAPAEGNSTSRPTNMVVVLKGVTADGRQVEGLGEGQPRSWRTGDDAGESWKFLAAAVETLQGQQIGVNDGAAAVQFVRDTMAQLGELASQFSLDAKHRHPFRGTLLGLEVALLDLIARARREPLAKLLGQRRQTAQLAPPALSIHGDADRFRRQIETQTGKYEQVRVLGDADIDATLGFAAKAADLPADNESQKPLWIDMNGVLTRESATELVERVVEAASDGRLPAQVIIEQPVPVKYSDHLARLQRQADEAVKKLDRSDLDIRIMGDESIWDIHSVVRVQKLGGLRAFNIRPAQAGGLLASIDLAERIHQVDPDVFIALTRMKGASRITASSLRNLALALPRIDGAVVASKVEDVLDMTRRITEAEVGPDGSIASSSRDVEQTASHSAQSDEEPQLIVHAVSDDEPELDYRSEAEGDFELTGSIPVIKPAVEEAASRAKPAEEGGRGAKRSEKGASSKLRTFGVRDVPGLAVALRFSGLVSDVEDAVIFPPPPEATYEGIPVTKYSDVDDLHPLGPNGSKGHLLEREALALGLNTTRYSKGAFTATDGIHDPVPFKWSRNPMSSATALALCTHKEATRMQLQQAGVPVPLGRTFARGDFATGRDFAERIGYPVVVKPAMGVRGIGVVAGIQDEEQLDAAFGLMSGSKLGNQDFIVEKHVHGADYRIVVIGDEVIAAIQREPASVFGDGTSTIAELLINKNTARKRNPHLWARPAKYDEAAQHELRKTGRDLETVLPKGERQLLANTCSLSQGGDSIDVLDELHPTIKEAAVKAVKAIPGLFFCGVDFLLEDHTKPLDEQDAGICELNAHAAIGNCEYPMFGKGRPVAKTMIRTTIEHFGLEADTERAETVALHLIVRGRVVGVNFRNWLQRRAQISGVSGWVRNLGKRAVEVVIVGPTDPATAVAAATILGPKNAVPTAYEATHIPIPDDLNGFEIREDAPQGTRVEAIDAS